MKLVRVAEENKRYYTKDFIHGFNTGAKAQLEADKKEAERRGRWEHLGGDEWFCTACTHVITTEESWERPWQKYCEECGAKMDGEQNG